MARSERSRDGYLIAGDGLRAVAALAVLAFHAFIGVATRPANRGVDWGPLGDLLFRLNVGVYVFFALSGYLVGGPWVRAWLAGGGYPRPLAYIGRRARRIVPAFWVITAGLLVWFGPKGAGAGDVLALLAFGQVFREGAIGFVLPQGWTLDVEVMFYLALPVLAWLVVRLGGALATPERRAQLLLGVLAALFAATLVLRTGPAKGLEAAGSRNLVTFAWAFVPGLALAALEPVARARLQGRREGRALALGLGALGLASVAALPAFGLFDGRLVTLLAYAGCGGGLVGGALAWQWATHAAPRGFDTRWAHALGRWSYGIYLVHVGVAVEVLRHVPGSLGPAASLAWVLAGTLVVSVALAALLWWLVEEPLLTGRRPRLPGSRNRATSIETPTGPPVAEALVASRPE